MKICLIAEGSYPYIMGGVSSWVHDLVKLFSDIEFILVAIITDRSISKKFIYELPNNLTKVYEIYLQDFDWVGRGSKKKKRIGFSKEEASIIQNLIISDDINWVGIFELLDKKDMSVNKLLMSPEFLEIVVELYNIRFQEINFTDFLWTLRSMYLPLLFTLKFKPPKADIYHCISTGYAGIVGSKAVVLHEGSRLLISEHGIYTREREQEIIKANWVKGIYKNIWIEQFKKMSKAAYYFADIVTSLFDEARLLQIELGCPPEKIMITPNGIKVERFEDIPMKDKEDPYINIGAILRIAPIKDVKTLITAFYHAQRVQPLLKLWIMGPEDENKEYAKECKDLVANLNAQNIYFTGRINTTEYIGKMDMLILTSISEGQPLTILEGFAAKKPSIATNVGNCRGLIYGENDDFGNAGIITSVMNIPEISGAILKLANNKELAIEMGENGYRRLMQKYRDIHMEKAYENIYTILGDTR